MAIRPESTMNSKVVAMRVGCQSGRMHSKNNARFFLVAVVMLSSSCAPVLYWTDHGAPSKAASGGNGVGSIMRLRLGAGPQKAEKVVSGIKHLPTGLAVDRRKGRVYWAVPDDRVIRYADLSQGEAKVFASEIAYPYRVAWDAVQRRVYWSANGIPQPNGGMIQWAAADDQNGEIHTVATGLNGPTGIALDSRPESRRIYWVLGGTGEIQSVSMDGTQPSAPMNHGKAPTSLAFDLVYDPQASTFYWPNEGLGSICRAVLTAGQIGTPETFVTTLPGSPSSLALDVRERKLYWGYRQRHEIQRTSLADEKAKEKQIYTVTEGYVGGLTIVHPQF